MAHPTNTRLNAYLARYAEKITISPQLLRALPQREFTLVIPSYKEDASFLERLKAHPSAADVLLTLVVNEPDTDIDNPTNRALIRYIDAHSELIFEHGHLALYQYDALALLCIRCISKHALPAKQGVGLARKIGADTACMLFAHNKIRQPWIYSSDADTQLSERYFELPDTKNVSAYYYNFRHVGGNSEVLSATLTYEFCLKYYRQKLLDAGSPYAFYSLGSAIAISMMHYAMVRGFPRRSAGEDFYLLNKLAKVAPVQLKPNDGLCIIARLSDRVPFGTGPAVSEILKKQVSGEKPSYYAPKIFDHLKLLLTNTATLWQAKHDWRKCLPAISATALEEAGFDRFLAKRLKQDANAEQFERSFHTWFDAFQTLKFVHRLREHIPNEEIDAIKAVYLSTTH